jgi:hypothetical protein
MQNLKSLVKSWILLEATRFKREMGENLPRWQEKLIRYEKDGGFYVHFSDVPRLGLFTRNKYKTPIGFYAYPLDRDRMSSFAVDRPYALVIKPKPEARFLDLHGHSEEELARDIQKLIGMGHSFESMRWAASEARDKSPGGKLWNITRILSGSDKTQEFLEKAGKESGLPRKAGGPTGTWTMLFRKLGYDGVVDIGDGIIHPSEPAQAVFFDTTKLDLVELIDKKKGKGSTVRGLFRVRATRKDLRGKDYGGFDLRGSIFDGSNLEGVNFSDSSLEEVDFGGAKLQGANFQRAKLMEANFRRADLTGADLTGASARYATFDLANFTGAILNGADFHGAGFLSADLSKTDLSGAKLQRCFYNSTTKFPEGFDPKEAGMAHSF